MCTGPNGSWKCVSAQIIPLAYYWCVSFKMFRAGPCAMHSNDFDSIRSAFRSLRMHTLNGSAVKRRSDLMHSENQLVSRVRHKIDVNESRRWHKHTVSETHRLALSHTLTHKHTNTQIDSARAHRPRQSSTAVFLFHCSRIRCSVSVCVRRFGQFGRVCHYHRSLRCTVLCLSSLQI